MLLHLVLSVPHTIVECGRKSEEDCDENAEPLTHRRLSWTHEGLFVPEEITQNSTIYSYNNVQFCLQHQPHHHQAQSHY